MEKEDLAPECALVRRRIAQLRRSGVIELLWHEESRLEFFGTYVLGGGKSDLVDAGVTLVAGPIEYSRAVTGFGAAETARDLQTRFLASVGHPRFLELQRACGALQGSRVIPNQLKDAFHLWCAESSGATHFLTTDFKLIRLIERHRTAPPLVRVVSPSTLIDDLKESSFEGAVPR